MDQSAEGCQRGLTLQVELLGDAARNGSHRQDIEDFAGKLRHGVALSLGDAAALKRLIFEAQTLTIADLRSSIQPGEEAQKKLPAAERSLRIENQRKRLVGLPLMKGSWQVAYALYDKFAHMMETEELRFVAPNECITRDAELAGGKPPKSVVIDANKTGLVLKDEESLAQMALTSDHELYQAMIRRALAMDVVGLATFATSQAWVERLFETLNQDIPAGFVKVSRAQLLRADRQSFVELARVCNGRLRKAPAGKLPLDDTVAQFHAMPEIMMLLLPTMQTGKGKGKGNKGKGQKRKVEDESEASPVKKPKLTRDPIPEMLKGMHSRTPANKAICFNYNLGKCTRGNKCRFAHVCCKPGCYKPHPMTEHSDSSGE